MAKFFVLFFIISTSTHLVCCGDGGLQERITGGTNDPIHNHYRGVCLLGSHAICMANSLTPLWYLTAAHCVPLPGTLGEYIFFASRRWCWTNAGEAALNPRSIRVVRHPRYVPGRVGGHDLAMVKANKAVTSYFYSTVLAPIPFSDDFKYCFVFGMGAIIWQATKSAWSFSPYEVVKFNKTLYHNPPLIMDRIQFRPRDYPGSEPEEKKKPTKNFFLSHLNMTARHGSCGRYPTHLQRRILCGNRVRGPKGEPVGVCYGDGGAPLMCHVNDNFYTFGVLSMIAPIKPGLERLPFYNTCGNVDYMDTFMYLCPYYGWIKSFDPEIELEIPPAGCGGARHSAINFVWLAALLPLISKIPIGT